MYVGGVCFVCCGVDCVGGFVVGCFGYGVGFVCGVWFGGGVGVVIG